jgi:hypothetical protein
MTDGVDHAAQQTVTRREFARHSANFEKTGALFRGAAILE